MPEFLKPQSPLKHKDGAFLYPLTTEDQVIMEDGSRLNAVLDGKADKGYVENYVTTAVAAIPTPNVSGQINSHNTSSDAHTDIRNLISNINIPVQSVNGKTGTIELNADDVNALPVNGNAATATKLATARTISLTGDVTGSGSFDGSDNLSITATVADNSHNHTNYLPIAGGTMTGVLTFKNTTATPAKGTILNCIQGQYQNAAGNYYTIGLVDLVASAEASTTVTSGYARFGSHNGASFFTAGESGRTMPKALADADTLSPEAAYITADSSIIMYAGCANDAASYTKAMTVASNKITSHVALYGAVWNDYAEYRNQKEEIKPGYCVASADNGQVYKTTEKFQACDGIVSDTFGFAIGETDKCKTPLAVAGRVLAYCEGNRYDYHSGDTVCAGPDGRVVKMTREEICEWPDRIIGIVSEIPEYETWGTGNVPVNGRIWIKIK